MEVSELGTLIIVLSLMVIVVGIAISVALGTYKRVRDFLKGN